MLTRTALVLCGCSLWKKWLTNKLRRRGSRRCRFRRGLGHSVPMWAGELVVDWCCGGSTGYRDMGLGTLCLVHTVYFTLSVNIVTASSRVTSHGIHRVASLKNHHLAATTTWQPGGELLFLRPHPPLMEFAPSLGFRSDGTGSSQSLASPPAVHQCAAQTSYHA